MKPLRSIINCLSVYINLAILAIIIVTICTIFPRHEELQFDYMGIIVGALSVLVSLLVGWQIYNTWQIKEDNKAMENRITINVFNMSKLMSSIDGAMELVEEGKYPIAFIKLLECLIMAEETKNDKLIDIIINDLTGLLELDYDDKTIDKEIKNDIEKYRDTLSRCVGVLSSINSENANTLRKYINNLLYNK